MHKQTYTILSTLLFLIILAVHAPADMPASAFNKRISVKYDNIPTASALKHIEKQSGCRLAIKASRQIKVAATVRLEISNEEVGRVLMRILQPRRMTLKVTGPDSAEVTARADRDVFTIKRQGPFEFTQKPRITRKKDTFFIRFETAAFCDTSVAVEDTTQTVAGSPRIIRHLASGVLGINAPSPFIWNSRKQMLIWDGKDDQGRYVAHTDADYAKYRIRVSLGLNPRLERTLYWAPEKRMMALAPRISACKEGVLMFEGRGLDRVLLFDHNGQYKRTIYPFSRETISKVKGVTWKTAVQDGKKIPVKKGFESVTLLTSGDSCFCNGKSGGHLGGVGASAIATLGDRIILARNRINRLNTDGTTGNRPLAGARTTYQTKKRGKTHPYYPTSAAISPDEKWLYLAGYGFRHHCNWNCLNVVQRVSLDGNGEPELFPSESVRKTRNGKFQAAVSVDCDNKGNVYVADYINNRIQVFSPNGGFLKSITVSRPAVVRIHRLTQDICCLSWMVYHPGTREYIRKNRKSIPAVVYQFGPLSSPKEKKRMQLPIPGSGYYSDFLAREGYLRYSGDIDSWADDLTVWVSRECDTSGMWGAAHGDGGRVESFAASTMVIREKNGTMQILKDFGKITQDRVHRVWPSDFSYQRLHVNPDTGRLFIKENQGPGKSLYQLIAIDPVTAKVDQVNMPFDAEGICFDDRGHLYLRTDKLVVRYDSKTLREIPWDYGIEAFKLGFSSIGTNRRRVPEVVSGLTIPGVRPVCWHQAGMSVSPTGNLVIGCNNYTPKRAKQLGFRNVKATASKRYEPTIYPGRRAGESVHVFDRHGKIIFEDAFQGISRLDGVFLDRNNFIYVMEGGEQQLDGKNSFSTSTNTIIKAQAGKARILSLRRATVPLPEELQPDRKPELNGAWIEGAEWLYGGVGLAPVGCVCWHSRFSVDYFGRSFAPETDHHSVAVLDTRGNLITRIGSYGNTDDGMPLIKEGGPSRPRPMGGDETALFYPVYVDTHSDRRLFIADPGNSCIRSVKLDYHTTSLQELKSIK